MRDPKPSTRDRVAQLLPALDAFSQAFTESPDVTIRPMPALGPAVLPGSITSPRASLHDLRGHRPDLTFDGVIGEGGMAIVRQATQLALHRKVAVKTLRPGMESNVALFALLHEAWIVGNLEHPNVVPVYDMGVDDEGRPLIVLKRIDGTPWSDVLAHPERLKSIGGLDCSADPIGWHIDVLLRVCTALCFAHCKGIVHRDLKPDNVMIGAFGEVYVLDWGIAVSLRDEGGGRFPMARDVREMAGTPCYMAPEMLAQPGDIIDERTDVYLLGAILFQILSDSPPHRGKSLSAVLVSVLESRPEIPQGGPLELVAACRRALSADKADRFQSVETLRAALQTWQSHRPSVTLCAGAERCAVELGSLLSDLAAPTPETDAQRRRRYNLLGECRFGFRQSLVSWPENERARDGLRGVLLATIEHELSFGDHRGAAALCGELVDAPPELLERIEAGRRAEEEADALALRARAHLLDYDLRIGARTRQFFAIVLGLAWTILPLVGFWRGAERTTWPLVVAAPLTFLVLVGILGYWARDSMTKTRVNRQILATLVLTLAAILWTDVWSILGGLSPMEGLRLQPIIMLGVMLVLAIAIERRFWPTTVISALAVPGLIFWPTATNLFIGLTGFVLSLNAVVIWRARAPS